VPFSEILGASHASEIAFVMGAPMYGSIGKYMYPDTESAAEMTEIMMTGWAEFARTGSPSLPDGTPWAPYDAERPEFMRLDAGGVGMSDDVPPRDELLEQVAHTELLSPLEQCLLVWELVTAVGVPDYEAYALWKAGRCAGTDAPAEKRRIREALEAEYGSVYFSG